jgi:predicted transcriptional regulator
MTQLAERAIKRLQSLPDEQQDRLAERLLARIEEEHQREVRLLDDIDEGIAAAERGDVSDGETVMDELRAQIEARS